MLGLTAGVEAVTWLTFMLVMVPKLRHRPLECIACITCATAAFYLHYRYARQVTWRGWLCLPMHVCADCRSAGHACPAQAPAPGLYDLCHCSLLPALQVPTPFNAAS